MTTQHSNTRPSKPQWVRRKNAHHYLHPDPAIDQRFSIRREFVDERKTPSFIIYDEFGKLRGYYDRLFNAKKAVETQIKLEAENPDIRVGVANDVARGDITKAFMRIIDYINTSDSEVKDAIESDLDELRRNLRNI